MESKPKKSETKLKIIIYGDDIDLESVSKLYDKKNCKTKEVNNGDFRYTKIQHNILEWLFLIISKGNIEHIINLMKDDYKTKYFHHV